MRFGRGGTAAHVGLQRFGAWGRMVAALHLSSGADPFPIRFDSAKVVKKCFCAYVSRVFLCRGAGTFFALTCGEAGGRIVACLEIFSANLFNEILSVSFFNELLSAKGREGREVFAANRLVNFLPRRAAKPFGGRLHREVPRRSMKPCGGWLHHEVPLCVSLWWKMPPHGFALPCVP